VYTFNAYLPWWLAGTAIVVVAIAATLTAYLAGQKSSWWGFVNGMTTWGVLSVVGALAVLPILFYNADASGALFPAFWGIAGSWALAGIGGMMAGAAQSKRESRYESEREREGAISSRGEALADGYRRPRVRSVEEVIILEGADDEVQELHITAQT
jgi:hypothetical protein